MVDNRATYTTKIRERRWLSKGTFELICDRPAGFAFRAGQKIQMFLAETSREFTIASGANDPEITLCIREIDNGQMSSSLSRMPIGSELTFEGPYGYFIFKPAALQAVFVATGTGIAPFISMARSHVKDFILLHGVSQTSELYYKPELKAAASRYIPCISDEQDLSSGHFAGRVTDYLETDMPRNTFDFYLCGNGSMIHDVIMLVDERFEGSRVFSEKFF